MSDQQRAPVEDQRVDAVLGALGDARPADGLEQRVLQRLAAEPVTVSPTLASRLPRLRFALPAAVAACALCTAVVVLHHAKTAPPRQDATVAASAVTKNKGFKSPAEDAAAHGAAQRIPERVHAAALRSGAFCDAGPCSGGARGVLAEPQLATASPKDATRERSYPAPAMPLTEQERLLLAIAHRDDPVQIAMLDPTERSMRQAREHAETVRFFTPPPLPPDLQHEIDAALRSQDVNTPPPNEQLSQE